MNTIRVLEMDWYWFTRRFPTATMANRVFEDVARYAKRNEGKLDTGLYRHGTHEEGMVYISGVSHQPEGIEKIARRVGGEDVPSPFEHLEALVLRRARVISELLEAGASGGSYRFPHHEGANLYADGELKDD